MEPEKRGGLWDRVEFFDTGKREITKVLGHLSSLGLVPTGTALDFGCGVGRLTQALASHFSECWGVDISPRMLQHARAFNRFPSTCHYVVNDAPDLKRFPDHRFNFIYSNIALQHIPTRYSLAYLREFNRILSPGGILAFQIIDVSDSGVGTRLRFYGDRLRERAAIRTRLRGKTPVALYAVPEREVRAALGTLEVIYVHADELNKRYVAVSPGQGPTW